MKNQKIWKLVLSLVEYQKFMLPADFEVLSAQVQDGYICAWILCTPDKLKRDAGFYIVGTGQNAPTGTYTYIGTVQMGAYVWHLFMEREAL